MSEPLLSLQNIDVYYRNFHAVFDVSLNIEEGKITSLIGANGAGKSTILKAICGINKPTSGRIIFNGEDITGLRTNEIAAKGIIMSPEGSEVFPAMSVKENLLMGAYLPKAYRKRNELLEKVYALFPILNEKEKQLATFLSGGQRQMLAIGRAIMADPKLIICDEISLGLSPVIIKDIYSKVHEINDEGKTIILVEQEVKRSLKHSDYAYILVKGRIVIKGHCDELSEKEVSDAYFGIEKYANGGGDSTCS